MTGRHGGLPARPLPPAVLRLAALLLAAGLAVPLASCVPGGPTATPRPTATPSAAPTATPSPEPTASPTPTPVPTPVDVFSLRIEPPAAPNADVPLAIPSYDGSGQVTHPKVLYFPDGWNGYKYWMAYTPYPHNDDTLENPSIAASQDGVAWVVPAGVVNPVSGLPPTYANEAHYSDPHLLMDGDVMELWFRHNYTQDPALSADVDCPRILRITSTDGVHWTEPEVMLDRVGRNVRLSPVVLLDESGYTMWYTGFDNKLYRLTSPDGKTWSKEAGTDLKFAGYRLWHQDILRTDLGYEIVFCARAYDGTSLNLSHQELFYAMSPDGIHFTKPVRIMTYKNRSGFLDDESIYRSSLVKTPDGYLLYYSARNTEKAWHIFLSRGPTISTLKGYAAP